MSNEYRLELNKTQTEALKQALMGMMKLNALNYGGIDAFYGSPWVSKEEDRNINIGSIYRAQLTIELINEVLRELVRKRNLEEWSGVGQLNSRLEEAWNAINTSDKAFLLQEKECEGIISACDTWSRVLMGQTAGLLDPLNNHPYLSHETKQWVENKISEFHSLGTGFPQGASRSISNPHISDSARVLYDIQQVLRHQLAKERDYGTHNVWRSVPMRTSREHSLPNLEAMDIPVTPHI